MDHLVNCRRNILSLKVYFEELKTLNIEQVPKYSSIVQVFGKICIKYNRIMNSDWPLYPMHPFRSQISVIDKTVYVYTHTQTFDVGMTLKWCWIDVSWKLGIESFSNGHLASKSYNCFCFVVSLTTKSDVVWMVDCSTKRPLEYMQRRFKFFTCSL